MIYDIKVPTSFEQGDICHNLPKISIDHPQISNDEDIIQGLDFWEKFVTLQDKNIISQWQVNITPIITTGIILSQSCDLRNKSLILFAEIRNFNQNFSKNLPERYNQIRRMLRNETRTHYLPMCKKIEEFKEPKVIDFKSLFLVPYNLLVKKIDFFFIARLIPEARVVLQEKIARFFTRLAYDEQIFLTDKELDGWKISEKISEKEFEETKSRLKGLAIRKQCM
ncbi:MAG TPA: hypothetical protein VKM55_01640 [Candidatus Lokiarchaeia archaeon]|nr:hypothetical protein [Candidatus Lokiarchaeia archaeon]